MSAHSVAYGDEPPRLAVLWCPDWSVVAAGASPLEPVAVLYANRVVARTPAAAAAGVRQRHRRREAQRICPSLRLIDHDPARDGREFEAAVRSVAQMVPRLEITEPGSLTFLARGPSRYFGGELAMAQRVVQLVIDAVPNVVTGIGIADGRFTAGVAARQSAGQHTAGQHTAAPTPIIIEAGINATRAFLDPLSVSTLADIADVSGDLIDLFRRLGVRRLGDLAALPAADVLARFGRPGVFAHRLACGGDDRAADAAAPPPELFVTQAFEDPVHLLDPLVFAAKQLAQQLHDLLVANGRLCTRLSVVAETEHGERSEHLWYRPNGLSVAAIVERVRWQLDGWIQQPGGLSGGIVLMRFTPDQVCSDDGSQLGFWGGRTEADEWAARAVARVAGLVGEQQVFVPAWRGGRQPGDAYAWVCIDTADVTEPTERLAVIEAPWPGHLPAPSPATVMTESVPAGVFDAAGHVVRVNGRGVLSAPPHTVSVRGRPTETITAWAGPWPIDERWWDSRQHRRMARFQFTTSSGEALLVVVEHQQWWITAVYS